MTYSLILHIIRICEYVYMWISFHNVLSLILCQEDNASVNVIYTCVLRVNIYVGTVTIHYKFGHSNMYIIHVVWDPCLCFDLVQLNHFFSKSLDGPEKGRLFVSRVNKFTCCWCTWSQPWFPQRRRAWPTLLEGEVGQQSGSLWRWWWTSCCSEPVWKPLQRFSRRYRWRSCSWCSWPCWRHQCRGAPVSRLCRCRWRRIPSSSSFSSCPQYAGPLPWRRPSWILCCLLWVACWCFAC